MKRFILVFLMTGLLTSALQAQNASKGRRGATKTQEPVTESMPGSNTPTDGEGFVASRESVTTENPASKKPLYNPKVRRDPTLSADDELILQDIAEKRRRAEEEERKRQAALLAKQLAEQERQRQWQLELLKHPELEVKRKIRIGGLIGKEVFFRDANKVYTAGSTISVIGESGQRRQVKIVAIKPDSVVFSYEGHQFVKKI